MSREIETTYSLIPSRNPDALMRRAARITTILMRIEARMEAEQKCETPHPTDMEQGA